MTMMTRFPKSRHLSYNLDYAVSHWCPVPVHDMANNKSRPLLTLTLTGEHPFPTLPPIHDDHIRTMVFTHRSLYARPNHVFEDHPDDPSPDNEKFEHLGDTVLGLVVTRLLYDTYPNLRVGPSTKIRALIVGNTTLASISRRYELPARLRSHPAQAISLRASTGIQADVFESYVGGLYLDQGPATAEKWLRSLFKPFATEAYIRVRTQHGLPPLPAPVSPPLTPSTSASSDSSPSSMPASKEPKKSTGTTSTPPHRTSEHHPPASGTPTTTGHLALFNQQLQKAKREVEWVYDDCVAESTTTTPIWAVRVEVDGEVIGRGKGGTRKAARNEAAKEGLAHMGIVV
ncbi:ribonuclease III domain-containing protein [Boletus edulis BED1]|uniref:Ribonuclease III domain-containing protein n=1 Tax=Boletus edulis BED1 TaxID=1328754 RepID=A0AAD4C7C3_BOLED|nr:ribonuclease III domain-containing protein [Boletus edulis BED1]